MHGIYRLDTHEESGRVDASTLVGQQHPFQPVFFLNSLFIYPSTYLFIFETESHIAQASFRLTMLLWLSLNSCWLSSPLPGHRGHGWAPSLLVLLRGFEPRQTLYWLSCVPSAPKLLSHPGCLLWRLPCFHILHFPFTLELKVRHKPKLLCPQICHQHEAKQVDA